jgi:hypothetical protein
MLDKLDKLDKLDRLDRLDKIVRLDRFHLIEMSPKRDVAFFLGLWFKTLRWFNGLICFAGFIISAK